MQRRRSTVLIQQPEVDPERVSVVGYSEGTTIVPRVAIDNPGKVNNIVLMGSIAQNFREVIYFQKVTLPVLYTQQVLDNNHNGLLSCTRSVGESCLQFYGRKFHSTSYSKYYCSQ